MHILITGGAGFLGSNLAERLLKEKNSVVVVDNLITGSKQNIADLRKYDNFAFYNMSIESDSFLHALLDPRKIGRTFDRVYDLACPTGVPNIARLGEEMVDACSTGTKNVLKVALAHKARFLFTSSSEIYGAPLVEPQSEEYTGNVDPQGARANYEEGKRFSETLVSLYVKKYKLHGVTVRLFNAYGPRMSLGDERVIPRFVSQALTGEPLTVHGDGSQTRTMCYVDDTVDALIRTIELGQPGKIYNIGCDEKITMRQLAELIIEMTHSDSEIISIDRWGHDHQSRLPELQKIRELGWKEKISLRDGIERTIENFKNRLLLQRVKVLG